MRVIARLTGGLGNQMFQYATARAFALRCDADLELDVSSFAHSSVGREYALEPFSIAATRVNEKPIPAWLTRSRFLDSLFVATAFRAKLRRQVSFSYGEELVVAARHNTYLVGYWQSPRYFEGVADVIRSDFELRNRSQEATALGHRINDAPSVSVHIRRGDYASDPVAATRHGVQTLEYYDRAFNLLEKAGILPQASIFLFSDDPDWCRNNFTAGHPVEIVEGFEPHEDMFLMSCCDHAVIANSSFSWWGAWLGYRQGICIAPLRWFSGLDHETHDLIPAAWKRI
jgi:hypothetical protein